MDVDSMTKKTWKIHLQKNKIIKKQIKIKKLQKQNKKNYQTESQLTNNVLCDGLLSTREQHWTIKLRKHYM